MKRGSNQHEGLSIDRSSVPVAAALFGVPVMAVARAAVVRDHAVPEVREAVRSEAVALSRGRASCNRRRGGSANWRTLGTASQARREAQLKPGINPNTAEISDELQETPM